MQRAWLTSKYMLAALAVGLMVGCNGGEESTANGSQPGVPGINAADLGEWYTEGAAFLGFGLESVKTFQVTLDEGEPQEGTEELTILSNEDEQAEILFDRQGALQTYIGNDKYRATPEGIYLVSAAVPGLEPQEFDDPVLHVPADLGPGSEWQAEQTFSTSDQTMDATVSYTAEDFEEIETPGGTFDALKVTSVAEGTLNGEPFSADQTFWLVRNLGTVRLEVELSGVDGNSVNLLVEYVGQELDGANTEEE
ncbi:MAG: hypothetical protein ACOCX1_01470 [Fimbriimonadaceae bacterium]